jgi:hypothetical protein
LRSSGSVRLATPVAITTSRRLRLTCASTIALPTRMGNTNPPSTRSAACPARQVQASALAGWPTISPATTTKPVVAGAANRPACKWASARSCLRMASPVATAAIA